MREKVTIEKQVSRQDSFGQEFREWETVCSVFAQSDIEGEGLTIKYRNDVEPKMRLVTDSTIFTIGRVIELNDGGVHLLKLLFSSARGAMSRAPQPHQATPALPVRHSKATHPQENDDA